MVEDAGPGIADETLPRIFESLYTTRPRVRGSGLGLSTVYAIVTLAEGAVDVRGVVGRETMPVVGDDGARMRHSEAPCLAALDAPPDRARHAAR